ncbi:hypothetical protein P692DRAFT_20525088 [Suillus brevipes Sb2]|nr:hypothetical protein P692DRAFT_20525088 [Suillus brevipes Sb2]
MYHHKRTGLSPILAQICTDILHFIPIPIYMLYLRTCAGILRTAIVDDHWLPRSWHAVHSLCGTISSSGNILVWPRLIYHSKTMHHIYMRHYSNCMLGRM